MKLRIGPKHKEVVTEAGGCRAKEPFGEPEGESDTDIAVYFTKFGTKVHLYRCQGLNTADIGKMKKAMICKYCMKMKRKKTSESFLEGSLLRAPFEKEG